ncbi:MAG: AtpZ/AtpI family protein [Bryobacteraceae bacterium]|jgi:ATP synthase protein I
MPDPETPSDRMIREVSARQNRMLKARSGDKGFWTSLQVLGTVGWSVALPTLLGIALGVFIDRHWPGRFSWTLMLLFAGLVLGCANAWVQLGGKRP